MTTTGEGDPPRAADHDTTTLDRTALRNILRDAAGELHEALNAAHTVEDDEDCLTEVARRATTALAVVQTLREEFLLTAPGPPWQTDDVVRDADNPDDPTLWQHLPGLGPWLRLGPGLRWCGRDDLPADLTLVARAGRAVTP